MGLTRLTGGWDEKEAGGGGRVSRLLLGDKGGWGGGEIGGGGNFLGETGEIVCRGDNAGSLGDKEEEEEEKWEGGRGGGLEGLMRFTGALIMGAESRDEEEKEEEEEGVVPEERARGRAEGTGGWRALLLLLVLLPFWIGVCNLGTSVVDLCLVVLLVAYISCQLIKIIISKNNNYCTGGGEMLNFMNSTGIPIIFKAFAIAE